jgi:hypothetical protein
MMTDHQTALCSLLLGSFPTFSSGDAEAALTAYELVMAQADERDLQPGVMLLINGEYPGHDGRFAPTAPQLASALRMARDRRLEHERIMNVHQARLPAPDIQHSPESQQRVRELTERAAERIGAVDAHNSAEATAAGKDRWEKTNARFQPPMDDDSVMRRLMGYSTGSPESDEAAA